MGRYVRIHDRISYHDMIGDVGSCSMSPSMYMGLDIPNNNLWRVGDFLERPLSRQDLGNEIGADNYIRTSPFRFMRTKALQRYSYLPVISDETALPMMPYEFLNMDLKEGDLIISKDSNIGETVILDKDYPNTMLSGALYRLPVRPEYKYYLLAFLKHDIFREQLDFIVPRGATIRHAKTLFLDCKIPMPSCNREETIRLVSDLTRAIIEKEKAICKRHEEIMGLIDEELTCNQSSKQFVYRLPSLCDVLDAGRMDAAIFGYEYKEKLHRITNYRYGCTSLANQNFILKPGPSLEVKLLGTRIDSDFYRKGFYRLITPAQITNYGTLKFDKYIGTPAQIARVQYGDMLFGESGTGRSMVYLDRDGNTINNAHAHILRPIDGRCSLAQVIFVRCVLQYYKECGITDCLTVGGAGGHLSPSYFDRVFIPDFPENKQEIIASLYYNTDEDSMISCYDRESFMESQERLNSDAGIYELDKEKRKLEKILSETIEDIIMDREVNLHPEI